MRIIWLEIIVEKHKQIGGALMARVETFKDNIVKIFPASDWGFDKTLNDTNSTENTTKIDTSM